MNFNGLWLARLYTALPAFAILMACGHNNNISAQRKEILALHDSVMALNSPLVAQEILLDSIATGKAGLPPALVKAARRQKEKTDALVDSMDNWMQHFEPETGSKPASEVQAYFAGERNKVIKLKNSYRKMLTENKAMLNSLPAGKTNGEPAQKRR